MYAALTFPIWMSARRLRISQPGWAFVPIGNLVTLVRVARAPAWALLAFLVPLTNHLVWAGCWVGVSRRAKLHPAWGWTCCIPGVNLLVPFLIAARIKPGFEELTEPPTGSIDPISWDRARVQAGMGVAQPILPAKVAPQRRQVTVALPPSWLIVQASTVAILVSAFWYDSRNTHYFLAEPGESTLLESRIAYLESRPIATSTTALRETDSRVSRAIDVAVLSYIVSYARSQNLGPEAAEGVYQRCREWIQSGSGSFETACT